MLALIVLLSLATTLVVAAAVKRHVMPTWLAVPIVTGLPLLGWLAAQLLAQPARSPLELEVLGQYHRLSEAVRVSAAPDADVVLRSSDADIALRFEPATEQLNVEVTQASVPIVLGERPINGIALERRTVLSGGAGETRIVLRPWLCWRCDTRYITAADGSERFEVRLSDAPRIALGDDTVRLVAIHGVAWAVASPRSGVRVNDVPIPALAASPGDSLFIGWPASERLLLWPLPSQHRIDVLFGESSSRRWVLPRPADDTLRVLVAATAGEPLPGTMNVINPAAVAPGAAAEPYGGVLALHEGQWSWLSGGMSRVLTVGEPVLLPGQQHARTAGHIVRIRQFDTDPAAARWAVLLAWLAGAVALSWLWRYLHPDASALRVAVLGSIYTLLAVRGLLAFRAWLAPPYDGNSPQTLIAALLALPLLAAALHIWSLYSTQRMPRRQALIELAVIIFTLLAASVVVSTLILPAWRGAVFSTVAAVTVVALAGLLLLNRLLLRGARVGHDALEPLAAVTLPAQPGYTYRQFLSAIIVLGVLAFLLLVVQQLLRYSTLLALSAWGLMAVGALLVTAGPRVLIRPRTTAAAAATGVVIGVAAAAVAWLAGLGWIATLLALVSAGGAAYVLRARASFAIRPVRVRELLGPPLLVAVAAALLAILLPGLVGATRVLAEYALALAGLIAIARIFTILWFRHTEQLVQHPHSRRARQRLPGIVSIGAVLLLLLGMLYAPLAVFDTGLVLLFFAATTTAIFLGFYAMGARTLAVLVPAVVGVVFFLGMFVRSADLEDGSASLNTAQIRYAATYHPVQLQHHLLASDDARPITTVRTLQQYWGVRHFAAGGTTGRGYFNAGYADWIVPRPVALTENVFSTFVLSEHGWLGGTAVLLCYLAIALALLYGAARACTRKTTAPHALLLVGLAAFWVVPAFYIAAANGVLLPLTGQNMPLLGLLSSADVALGCWLAGFGLTALPLDTASGTEHLRSGGWVSRLRVAIGAVGAVFVLAAVSLIALLWRPAHAEVGDFSLDAVVANTEALVQQGALQVARTAQGSDTIAVAAAAATHPYLKPNSFMRARIRRANSMARGEPGGASCLDSDALLRPRDGGSIAVFTSLCAIRANAESRFDWTGPLVANAARSEFVLSDGRTAVLLDPQQETEVVLGCTRADAGAVRARAVRLGCGAASATIRFGTSAPVLERIGTEPVLLNGTRATAPTLLGHGDHLRLDGSADVWSLALPHGALVHARWENAATRRVLDAHATPWLAQLDSQLARGLARADRIAWAAELTLRFGLHHQLQRMLAQACESVPGARRCSVLLADPYSGEVLALGATGAQPHRYLSADPNLRNHPAASAIKPIIAAAALHAYPQLRTLEIEHSTAEYSTVANTAVQPSIRAGRLYPTPRVPWRGYLGASDNLYAATLGFLATSARDEGGVPALSGNEDRSQLRLNGRPLRGQPSWAARRGRLDLSESPLAAALEELYGVHVKSELAPTYDRTFWHAAIAAGALTSSPLVQRITPEPVSLDMNAFSSAREVAAFMIGGDRNRWNNVALVQALSRIYSGRAVDLHVLRRVGPHPLSAEPGRFAGSEESRRAVLDAMAAVTDEPWGTAYALRNTFPAGLTWRAKTGTLHEREWIGSIFLFAGGSSSATARACAAAGVVTVELSSGTPEGKATAVFRDAVAPLLKRYHGWGESACIREPRSTAEPQVSSALR